ncbi:MAG: hypothetical protein PHU77_00590 [Simplicispira sp.]|nr:hypothetical protein [Simplicispira sp.]
MTSLAYQSEPWFALLGSRTEGTPRSHVARQLGISPAALSQVLNGSGKYGTGEASTAHIAERVVHTFGRYHCPHLTEEAGGEKQVVSAVQCRAFAHRPAPTGSPRDMQHWQACRQCPHRVASAPPVPREAIPRTPKSTSITPTLSLVQEVS